MREIKFREWDPVREEMYADYDNSVHFGMSYSTRIEYDNSTGFVFRHEEDIDHEFRDKKIVDVHGEPTRKLMQYTGIKDKNGKPIFEGDIVKVVSQYWGQLGNRYEVKFKQGTFCVKYSLLSEISRSTLVIGNIHENPELLEVDE